MEWPDDGTFQIGTGSHICTINKEHNSKIAVLDCKYKV
jgi:hypothetical protein